MSKTLQQEEALTEPREEINWYMVMPAHLKRQGRWFKDLCSEGATSPEQYSWTLQTSLTCSVKRFLIADYVSSYGTKQQVWRSSKDKVKTNLIDSYRYTVVHCWLEIIFLTLRAVKTKWSSPRKGKCVSRGSLLKDYTLLSQATT